MSNFSVDRHNLEFVLFDQLAMHERLGKLARYADFDRDIYSSASPGSTGPPISWADLA